LGRNNQSRLDVPSIAVLAWRAGKLQAGQLRDYWFLPALAKPPPLPPNGGAASSATSALRFRLERLSSFRPVETRSHSPTIFTNTSLRRLPSDWHLTGLVSEHGDQGQTHWLLFLFEAKGRLTLLPLAHYEGRFQFFSRDGACAAG
jgi:hypothetical protein